MGKYMKNNSRIIFKKKMMQKVTALVTAFAMLFQIVAPAAAAILPDYVIESDLNANPQFELVFSDPGYQYIPVSYLRDSALAATNISIFYKTLEAGYRHTLGVPTYVPIAVGDITTIIPIYKKHKHVGSPLVQSRYIRAQINAILGRNLINSDLPAYANESAQLNTLYGNTLEYINTNPALVFGQKLGRDQADSGLAKDIIWPELRLINGEEVIVPVIYLTSSTVSARAVTSHVVTFNGGVNFNQLQVDGVDIQFGRQAFLQVANDLINNQGALTGTDDLQIVVGGTLNNISGTIQATGDLKIGAHSINSQTIVHRYDFGNEQGGRFGEVASFNTLTGDVTLRSYSDILLHSTQVSAGGDITFAADGSIYIGSQQLYSGFEGHENGWIVDRSNVEYLQSGLTAEDTIKLIANGEIIIDAAEIVSNQGHIEILAGLGITIEDDLSVNHVVKHGQFGKRTVDESIYQTVAIRALLDAGKGIRLHSELGDVTLRAVDINSAQGASVKASNGAVNLLMTTETDHYSFSSVKKGMFTTSTTQRGHNIETGVPNTIVGGFAVEAFTGVNVEYEGDPTLTLEEQIAKLSQLEGLEWMANVRANTQDVDWTAIELQYDTWDKSSTSLSPAFAAVISISVAIATSGASTGWLDAAWLDAALNAGISSLASQATIALANGIVNGDVGQALEGLRSSDTFRSLAVAMVTAGAMAKIDASFFTADTDAIAEAVTVAETSAAAGASSAQIQAAVDAAIKNASTLSLSAQALQAVTHATVQAGIATEILGGDFRDQFIQSLAQQGIDVLGQHMANEIHMAFDSANATSLDTALKYISHAGAGCFLGVATAANSGQTQSGSACASGAGGAVIGEVIATQYRTSEEVIEARQAIDNFMYDNVEFIKDLKELDLSNQGIKTVLGSTPELSYYTSQLNNLKQKGVDLARLGAAIGAFAAGADAAGVNLAADLGANAAESNALFLIVALPIVLTAIDVALTGIDLVEIYEAYESGDTDKGNELFAIFAVGSAAGALIPGDKILAAIGAGNLLDVIIEYSALYGRKLGDNAASIVDHARSSITPAGSGRIPNVDIDKPVINHNSEGGRGGLSNPLNTPEANTIYHVDGKYRYETDTNGRVMSVSGDLDLTPGTRSCYQQKFAGACGLTNDEGGHLIGTQFEGPGEQINLVPQDATLNRGAGSPWTEMEREWATALDNKLPVNVEMIMNYSGTSNRPDSFVVDYTIDGLKTRRTFQNQAGG